MSFVYEKYILNKGIRYSLWFYKGQTPHTLKKDTHMHNMHTHT